MLLLTLSRDSRALSRRVRLLALLAAAGLVPPAAAPAHAETLQDAIAAAYARNPTLDEQRYRLRARNENYVQARAQYGPTLTFNAQGAVNNEHLNGRTIEGDTGAIGLTLTQPIYTSGRLRGQLANTRASVLSGQQTLRQVEAQTIQNVVLVYAAVLRDEQRVQVSRENVIVLQDQLRENRARRHAEDATITDVAQADARLADGETQLAALEAQLAISRGQYLQIVGNNPGTLAPLPDLPGMPGTADQAYAQAEADNPTLLAAKYTEQASSATVASVRGQGRPQLSVQGQASYVGPLTPIERSRYQRNLAATVTLSQPLFSSGIVRSRIRQAVDNNNGDQVAVDGVRRQVLQQVTVAWSTLAAARVALTSGLRQVESAQIAFAGMQHERQFGLRSTIEVLNAEQELQSAQLTLLQNRYTEYLARAQLLAAVGRLEARYVAPDVAVQDPEQEFRRVRNLGRTPIEPVAQLIDRIGSSGVRRPLSAELTGEDRPVPDIVPALPPQPDARFTRGPLVPIRESPLVPADRFPHDRMPGGDPVSRPGLLPETVAPRPPSPLRPAPTPVPSVGIPAPPPVAADPR